MEMFGPLGLSFIAGISTTIGCVFIFLKIKRVEEFIAYSLAFSFAVMFLLSIFDLIPSSLRIIINDFGGFFGVILAFLMILLGSTTIRIINDKIPTKNNCNLYRVGVLSMISLMAHNIPEGIAVYVSAYSDIALGISVCIAIMLHNIPEGIAISVPLYYSGIKRRKVVLYTLVSGLSELFGAIMGHIFLRKIATDNLISFVLLFVAGLMLNLSYNDILKEALSYNKFRYVILGIVSGGVMFVIAGLI